MSPDHSHCKLNKERMQNVELSKKVAAELAPIKKMTAAKRMRISLNDFCTCRTNLLHDFYGVLRPTKVIINHGNLRRSLE